MKGRLGQSFRAVWYHHLRDSAAGLKASHGVVSECRRCFPCGVCFGPVHAVRYPEARVFDWICAPGFAGASAGLTHFCAVFVITPKTLLCLRGPRAALA